MAEHEIKIKSRIRIKIEAGAFGSPKAEAKL
jgi:hypothetical protein